MVPAACAPVPSTEESQEALWRQFGNQPLDAVLLAWGAPAAETTLTKGGRLVTYRRSTVFDSHTAAEQNVACEVTFLAEPPKFHVVNVAMRGAASECRQLAQGRTGNRRVAPAVQPWPNAYPYPTPYNRIPF